MLEDSKIEQKSDAFLSGKAIIDLASLFTVIMIKGVCFFT